MIIGAGEVLNSSTVSRSRGMSLIVCLNRHLSYALASTRTPVLLDFFSDPSSEPLWLKDPSNTTEKLFQSDNLWLEIPNGSGTLAAKVLSDDVCR